MELLDSYILIRKNDFIYEESYEKTGTLKHLSSL